MDWDWGPEPWVGIFPLLGAVLQTAFWVAAVVVLIMVLRRRPGQTAGPRRSPALDALEERYARGEIERDEFLERRAVLERDAGAGPASS
jgi:putative membrane protein